MTIVDSIDFWHIADPGPEITKLSEFRFYMKICEQNFELSMKSYSERFRNLGPGTSTSVRYRRVSGLCKAIICEVTG